MTRDLLPVLIFGSGGTSRESAFIIDEMNKKETFLEIEGFIEKDRSIIGREVNGYPVVTSDEFLLDYVKDRDRIGIVIPIGDPRIKSDIHMKLVNIRNIEYPNIIHPSFTYDKKSLSMEKGNIILAGVRMTTNIHIGNFNFFNQNVTVGHDAMIGDYCVVNPLASISGWVTLKGRNLIGTGANILENLTIGHGTTVGAGSVVTKNIEDDKVVIGIPARELIRQKRNA